MLQRLRQETEISKKVRGLTVSQTEKPDYPPCIIFFIRGPYFIGTSIVCNKLSVRETLMGEDAQI